MRPVPETAVQLNATLAVIVDRRPSTVVSGQLVAYNSGCHSSNSFGPCVTTNPQPCTDFGQWYRWFLYVYGCELQHLWWAPHSSTNPYRNPTHGLVTASITIVDRWSMVDSRWSIDGLLRMIVCKPWITYTIPPHHRWTMVRILLGYYFPSVLSFHLFAYWLQSTIPSVTFPLHSTRPLIFNEFIYLFRCTVTMTLVSWIYNRNRNIQSVTLNPI